MRLILNTIKKELNFIKLLLMNLSTKLQSIILRYQIGSISGDDAMEEITSLMECPIIPFNHNDFNEFMLKVVRRKGLSFEGEYWIVIGLSQDKILIRFDAHNFEWKSYSSMLEDWIFSDGKPFGKEVK
jgi:hypothetical protein